MDETTRAVAWAIAGAWWRKTHRQAAGALFDAHSAEEYADACWQTFCPEARAAISAFDTLQASHQAPRVASNRFA